MIDVGKLILAMAKPAAYQDVLLRVAESGEGEEAVERELIGTTHSEAGAYLLWQWGLPITTVECVAFHHRVDLMQTGPYELLAAVHAADGFYEILACGEPASRVDLRFMERAGVLGDLDAWQQIVRAAIED
ncbi:MAG: HDOD domain-containing protein [Myxococcales bacterium]|nr:HDOD domain-containing protein [Myxococcales bacterium]